MLLGAPEHRLRGAIVRFDDDDDDDDDANTMCELAVEF